MSLTFEHFYSFFLLSTFFVLFEEKCITQNFDNYCVAMLHTVYCPHKVNAYGCWVERESWTCTVIIDGHIQCTSSPIYFACTLAVSSSQKAHLPKSLGTYSEVVRFKEILQRCPSLLDHYLIAMNWHRNNSHKVSPPLS